MEDMLFVKCMKVGKIKAQQLILLGFFTMFVDNINSKL